eukprot:TRINITY_DN8002_c0_g1_i1.p1 TRINITY_DN8002_c0_g1~~TRINITY_DN8002_c0_g1_i1.p1  ORF type:complete len:113 (+),score=39.30 TRINITY_DN8002_c0_g1_i1:83-421(+)
MGGLRVDLKWGKVMKELEFPAADEVTLGDLRTKIEQDVSVPKDKQTLMCSGKNWRGVAFGDDMKVLAAAEAVKGVKDAMGIKVVTVGLMAPAGCDGAEEIDKVDSKTKTPVL